MTNLDQLVDDRSRHADCQACGQTIGFHFDEVHSTFEFEDCEWEIDRRVCGECGHADASARHTTGDMTVILTLAHPSKTCFSCDDRAIATVIEMEDDADQTVEHFCNEHANERIRILHHRVKRLTMEMQSDSRE